MKCWICCCEVPEGQETHVPDNDEGGPGWYGHPEPEDCLKAVVMAERKRCHDIAQKAADDPHASNPSAATAESIAKDIAEPFMHEFEKPFVDESED